MSELTQSGSVVDSRLNIVTTDKVRAKLAHAIAETGRLPVIRYLAFGDGGLDDNGQPISPDPTANALNHELFRLPIESVGYSLPYKADLEVNVTSAEFNDTPISEFGAVDEEGDFVGFQTFLPVTKQDIVTLAFCWTCQF